MIADYCNQSATLKTVASRDGAGDATYTTSTIAVRFEPHTREVATENGRVVTCQARIFTPATVRVGDVITYASRDWPVHVVKAHPDMDGDTDGCEVWL